MSEPVALAAFRRITGILMGQVGLTRDLWAVLGMRVVYSVEHPTLRGLSIGLRRNGFVRGIQFAKLWIWSREEINNGLDTRELVPNRPSPPCDAVLAGGIVADTARVDTQRPTGRHRTSEVVTLRDDDHLGEIEDSLGAQA